MIAHGVAEHRERPNVPVPFFFSHYLREHPQRLSESTVVAPLYPQYAQCLAEAMLHYPSLGSCQRTFLTSDSPQFFMGFFQTRAAVEGTLAKTERFTLQALNTFLQGIAVDHAPLVWDTIGGSAEPIAEVRPCGSPSLGRERTCTHCTMCTLGNHYPPGTC